MGIYEPTDWVNSTQDDPFGGTAVNAARMNNIEGGIVSALPAVGEIKLSKTAINPAEVYGGTWDYYDNHMFLGFHVYQRTA